MRLQHGRTAIALHELTSADGPALLLLHALGGSSADWGELPALWPGSVFALDFSGHGESERVRGGVYLPEFLVADADIALAHIGGAALAGAGFGAYAALLLAGGRPAQVPAALLLPGRGLHGGGPQPDFDRTIPRRLPPPVEPPLPAGCDPMAYVLERDVRPPEYAEHFAAAARRLLLFEDGTPRPPWWERARSQASAAVTGGDLPSALARLRAAAL